MLRTFQSLIIKMFQPSEVLKFIKKPDQAITFGLAYSEHRAKLTVYGCFGTMKEILRAKKNNNNDNT